MMFNLKYSAILYIETFPISGRLGGFHLRKFICVNNNIEHVHCEDKLIYKIQMLSKYNCFFQPKVVFLRPNVIYIQ